MILEPDRQYLLALIRREGIDEVLLTVVAMHRMASQPAYTVSGRPPRLTVVQDEEIVEVVEASKPVIRGSRIITATAPKRRSRQQPPELSGRIVHAAPKPKKGDDE